MRRIVGSLMLLVAFAVGAEEPKKDTPSQKPLYERLLKGEDLKKATKLAEAINVAQAKDDYAAAIGAAEELLELRRKSQGGDQGVRT